MNDEIDKSNKPKVNYVQKLREMMGAIQADSRTRAEFDRISFLFSAQDKKLMGLPVEDDEEKSNSMGFK